MAPGVDSKVHVIAYFMRISNMFTIENIKLQASILKSYLLTKEIDLSHTSCLHAIAKIHGFKNWNTLKGLLDTHSTLGNKLIPIKSAVKNRLVLQFKITLLEVEPLAWRRIQISDSCTFWDLHVAIQDAMGWNDAHLHEFTVMDISASNNEFIGIPPDPDEDYIHPVLPSWGVQVRDYINIKDNKKMLYLYDFGDGWQHVIEFEGEQEKIFKKYPVCLAGECACPPEDVGGTQGYERLLAIMQDPNHEEHEDFKMWVGGKLFDPQVFDPKAIKFDNPKTRYIRAFMEEDV
jgi:hypothetical protein